MPVPASVTEPLTAAVPSYTRWYEPDSLSDTRIGVIFTCALPETSL